ncbi:MAG: hypothetical protein ACI9YT_000171 [Halobacteriales archaeon]|jgi:hypothetical protein
MTLTPVFWTALGMAIVVGVVTVVGPRITTPIFEETEGVRVPARVIRFVRYGTIGGGALATVGFLVLATAEWARIGELGLAGIAGVVLGGPVFSVALGASIALVLKVRDVERDGDRSRRSRVEK